VSSKGSRELCQYDWNSTLCHLRDSTKFLRPLANAPLFHYYWNISEAVDRRGLSLEGARMTEPENTEVQEEIDLGDVAELTEGVGSARSEAKRQPYN
jgi:allophanate hydrolase subunit 2